MGFNALIAELNPVCHLLALLGAHHILHVSRIRVNLNNKRHALKSNIGMETPYDVFSHPRQETEMSCHIDTATACAREAWRFFVKRRLRNIVIQGVTGGTDQTSRECSLGQTIPI